MQQLYLPIAAAVVLLVASIWPQGVWTERFVKRQTTAEQKALAERLKDLPMEFGDWKGKEVPMDPTQREAGGLVGDFSVAYQNQRSPGQMVQIMIGCGHGRDIGRHTPDQCYIASGFRAADDERKYPIDMQPTVAQFTTCRFRKHTATEGVQNIRVFWSFSDDGEWVGPNRTDIVTKPALYKIYATTNVNRDVLDRLDDSVAVSFLREFMPLVNKVLFSPEDAASGSPDNPADEALLDALLDAAPADAPFDQSAN